MSNTSVTAAELTDADGPFAVVVHDFGRHAEDELAGRGTPVYTYSVGGDLALQSGPLAA